MNVAEPLPVIVCEQSGNWAPLLRQYDWPRQVRWIETRSLQECSQRLAEQPACLVLVEVPSERAAALAAWTRRVEEDFPTTRVIALANHQTAWCEPLLREAGAIHVLSTARQIGTLRPWLTRHFKT